MKKVQSDAYFPEWKHALKALLKQGLMSERTKSYSRLLGCGLMSVFACFACN